MKKKTTPTFAALIGALCLASTASAIQITLTTDDAYYLGSIVNGVPCGDGNELSWLNELIGMEPNTSQESTDPAGETLHRSSNDFGDLKNANSGVKQDDNGSRTVELTSAYVLGKYGNGSDEKTSYVWYIGGLSEGDILDLSAARTDLSHTNLFSSASVPDGGATVALLGLSILGFGAVRRKLKA